MKVALAADPRADNQFESALRALALEAGLAVVPQVPLFTGDRWVRPDLLDAGRALAVEAESFTWHGNRHQLMRDCRKYNDLTSMGLSLLRFAWEHVMVERAYTRSVLGRLPRDLARGAAPTRPGLPALPDPPTHVGPPPHGLPGRNQDQRVSGGVHASRHGATVGGVG